jgi:hypothetical protein
MDRTGDNYVEWNKSSAERWVLHDLIYVEFLTCFDRSWGLNGDNQYVGRVASKEIILHKRN